LFTLLSFLFNFCYPDCYSQSDLRIAIDNIQFENKDAYFIELLSHVFISKPIHRAQAHKSLSISHAIISKVSRLFIYLICD
jgi:hypothetical protein